jgi:hypothetical protein
MTAVIAVVGAPVEQFPLWRWLPGVDLRLILDDPAPRGLEIPVEHLVLGRGERRSASLSALIEQLCAQRMPDRIVHLHAADAQRVAAARTLHGLDGQQLAFAALLNDRVALRESLRRAAIPLADYTAVARPADLRAFVEERGYPVRVRSRFAQAPWPNAVLSNPGELTDWIKDGYQAAPEGWVADAAERDTGLRVDALCRDLPPELCWAAESGPAGAGAPSDARITLALPPGDERIEAATRILGAALSALPHSDVCLVHAELYDYDGALVLVDLGCDIDERFPRSLMRAALGLDPVRRYAQAAAGLLLPPTASRPQHLSGRVTIPVRRGQIAHSHTPPDRFTVPGCSFHLPAPVRHGHSSGASTDDAWFETAGQDRETVREELLAFAAWFEQAARGCCAGTVA